MQGFETSAESLGNSVNADDDYFDMELRPAFDVLFEHVFLDFHRNAG